MPLWFTAMTSPSILRSPAGGTLPSCQRFTPHGQRASLRIRERGGAREMREETFCVTIRSCRPPRAAAGMAGANASAESTQAAAAATSVLEKAMIDRRTLFFKRCVLLLDPVMKRSFGSEVDLEGLEGGGMGWRIEGDELERFPGSHDGCDSRSSTCVCVPSFSLSSFFPSPPSRRRGAGRAAAAALGAARARPQYSCTTDWPPMRTGGTARTCCWARSVLVPRAGGT